MAHCAEAIEFTTIDKGELTQYLEGGLKEITRIEEWRQLWQVIKPSDDVPEVNFGQYRVVAVFSGNQPTNGYSLEITGVGRHEEAGLSIKLEYCTPGKRFVNPVITNPYHIIQIPKN